MARDHFLYIRTYDRRIESHSESKSLISQTSFDSQQTCQTYTNGLKTSCFFPLILSHTKKQNGSIEPLTWFAFLLCIVNDKNIAKDILSVNNRMKVKS